MDKRIIIPGFIIILIGSAIAIYSPHSTLSRVEAEFNGIGLHKAKMETTMFIAQSTLHNPTNSAIHVESVEATMTINGTDHHSGIIGYDSLTAAPDMDTPINPLIMCSGSPVGYQAAGTVKYRVETILSIQVTCTRLGVTAERTIVVEDSRNWYYSKTE